MITINSEMKERIFKVLKRCVTLPEEFLEISNWQKPLTGNDCRLSATDLVYLLFELEEEFEVRIPPEALNDYGFSTIKGICSIIQEQIDH